MMDEECEKKKRQAFIEIDDDDEDEENDDMTFFISGDSDDDNEWNEMQVEDIDEDFTICDDNSSSSSSPTNDNSHEWPPYNRNGETRAPPTLKSDAELEPFQREFLKRAEEMEQKRECSSGMILADEMGLGKTIQMLAHIIRKWTPGSRSLIICPKSSIDNWIKQAAEHTENLIVRTCCKDNKYRFDCSADIIVTNYETLLRFFKIPDVLHADRLLCANDLHFVHPIKLCKELPHFYSTSKENPHVAWISRVQSGNKRNPFGIHWDYVVLDEAHRIRNFSNQQAIACLHLFADNYYALTGTPMQLSVKELFSLLYFIRFRKIPRPAEWSKDWHLINPSGSKISYMKMWLNSMMMRRTLSQISDRGDSKRVSSIGRLSKFRHIVPFESEEEKGIYDQLQNALCASIKKLLLEREMNRGTGKRINLCDALQIMLRCRQLCVAEYLMTNVLCNSWRSIHSTKMNLLRTYLTERRKNDGKIIIFSNFVSALDLVEQVLDELDLCYARIDGSTSSKCREQAVQQFQNNPKCSIFLLSLKAGGESLNLTKAERVIMLDPWFNPQAMNQAEKRAHRIGNLNDEVIVTYIAIKDTVEEKVLNIADKRSDLFESIINGNGPPIRADASKKKEPSLRSLDGMNKLLNTRVENEKTYIDEESEYAEKVHYCNTIANNLETTIKKGESSSLQDGKDILTVCDIKAAEETNTVPQNTAVFFIPYNIESKCQENRCVYSFDMNICMRQLLLSVTGVVMNSTEERKKELDQAKYALKTARYDMDMQHSKVVTHEQTLKAVMQAHENYKTFAGRPVTPDTIEHHKNILNLEQQQLKYSKLRVSCYQKQVTTIENTPTPTAEECVKDLFIQFGVQRTTSTIFWTDDEIFRRELQESFKKRELPLTDDEHAVDFCSRMLDYDSAVISPTNPIFQSTLQPVVTRRINCSMVVAFTMRINPLQDFLLGTNQSKSDFAVDENLLNSTATAASHQELLQILSKGSASEAEYDNMITLLLLHHHLHKRIDTLDAYIYSHWLADETTPTACALVYACPSTESILVVGCTGGGERFLRGFLRALFKYPDRTYPTVVFRKLFFPLYVWNRALNVKSFGMNETIIKKDSLSCCEYNSGLWCCELLNKK